MLEFKTFFESTSEIVLAVLLIFLSVYITFFIYKIKKGGLFVYGFAFIVFWNILEGFDEFFVRNFAREVVFNIGGRVVLIIGMLMIYFALRKAFILKSVSK